VFRLTSVPVLSDVAIIFFSTIVVLAPKCSFWTVPILHSVSDTVLDLKQDGMGLSGLIRLLLIR